MVLGVYVRQGRWIHMMPWKITEIFGNHFHIVNVKVLCIFWAIQWAIDYCTSRKGEESRGTLGTSKERTTVESRFHEPPGETQIGSRNRKWHQITLNQSINNFKSVLYGYYSLALAVNYDPDSPRSFKTICLNCNTARFLDQEISCCMWFQLLLLYLLF